MSRIVPTIALIVLSFLAPSPGVAADTVDAAFLIFGSRPPGPAAPLEKAIADIQGINSVKVDLENGCIYVSFDEKAVGLSTLGTAMARIPEMAAEDESCLALILCEFPDIKRDSDSEKAAKSIAQKFNPGGPWVAIRTSVGFSVAFALRKDDTKTVAEIVSAFRKAGIVAAVPTNFRRSSPAVFTPQR